MRTRMGLVLFWVRYCCAALAGIEIGLLLLRLFPEAEGDAWIVIEAALSVVLLWSAFGPSIGILARDEGER